MNEDRADSDAGDTHSMLDIRQYSVDQVVVIEVTGEVDALTAPQLTTAIGQATAASPDGLIVDLPTVTFLASAGMSVLITAHQESTVETRFGVVADGSITRRPLTLVGLDNVITLYHTLDEALADMRSA